MPQRNDPCPCGSGKKFKKCCGAPKPRGPQPNGNAELFQRASSALAAGKFLEAESCCQAMLRHYPGNADIQHLCGIVCYRLGNLSEARARLTSAVQLAPDNALLHSNFSLVLHDSGDLEAAVASVRRAIARDPRLAAAYGNLALVLKAQGDLPGAAAAAQTAIDRDPASALFHVSRADLHLLQGNIEAAEHGYRHAMNLAPGLVAAFSGLGALCLQQRRWDEARDWLGKALDAGADDPVVYNNLGLALFRLREVRDAVDRYRQALVRKPDFGGAHYNLGLALEILGKEAAVDAFAAAIHHGYAGWEVFDALSRAALRFGKVDRVYSHALRLSEDSACPHELLPPLIAIFGQACDFSARERVWRKFMDLYGEGRVDNETIRILVGNSLYPDFLNEDFVRQLHRSLGAALEAPFADRKFSAYRESPNDRRLRIGYLSPDLRSHSVGHFIQHVIANHDPVEFEVVCYSLSSEGDDVTDFIRRHATRFVQADALDDDALAQRIHDDGIHVLIDLAGYSMHNRIRVLARKPAPLQLTWIGYLHSPGMQSLDYRVTDPHVDDPAASSGPERLLVLPESFLCMGGFPDCELESQPPVMHNGYVTFASFNNLAKVTAATVRVWAQVLTDVPGSRLVIASTDADSQAVGKNLSAEFARHGVGSERVELRASRPRLDYLRAHNDVDIVLDTWPFNGGTVTAGALWMGVPVVTLVGAAHRQRIGFSMLKNIGIEDTLAWSEDEYTNTAVSLAKDPDRLARLRRSIAAGTRRSILCDTPRFTHQLETALRRAWEEYVAHTRIG